MSVVSKDNRSGHVTFQNRYYIGGTLFGINSQHPFIAVGLLAIGCGCNGTEVKHVKHYLVSDDRGNSFWIDNKYVVETNVPIPISAQNFDEARRNQHLNPGTDFSDIVAQPDPSKIWNVVSGDSATDRLAN